MINVHVASFNAIKVAFEPVHSRDHDMVAGHFLMVESD